MKDKKSYSLSDLVAQCDPDAPMPETLREWDQAALVGLEQVVRYRHAQEWDGEYQPLDRFSSQETGAMQATVIRGRKGNRR